MHYALWYGVLCYALSLQVDYETNFSIAVNSDQDICEFNVKYSTNTISAIL